MTLTRQIEGRIAWDGQLNEQLVIKPLDVMAKMHRRQKIDAVAAVYARTLIHDNFDDCIDCFILCTRNVTLVFVRLLLQGASELQLSKDITNLYDDDDDRITKRSDCSAVSDRPVLTNYLACLVLTTMGPPDLSI